MEKGNYRYGFYIKNGATGKGTYQYVGKMNIGFPAYFMPERVKAEMIEGDIEYDIDKVEDTYSNVEFQAGSL